MFNKYNIPKNPGGFELDQFNGKDWNWEQLFGGTALSAEQLPKSHSWRNQMPRLPIQGDEKACCSHTFATYNMFHSWKEGNKIDLGPRPLYSLTGEPDKGRSFRSQVVALRDIGANLESELPNDVHLSHNDYCNASLVTPEMRERAKQYRIKNWSVIAPTGDNLKRAVYREPIAIATGGNNADWKHWQNIPDSGIVDWYHATLLIGWTEDGRWEIANWWRGWGDNQYGFLSPSYHIIVGYSMENIPDFPEAIEGYVAIKYLKASKFIKDLEVAPTSNLNIRTEPMGTKIKTLQKGTVCAIMSDEVVDKEGYQWQQVKVI